MADIIDLDKLKKFKFSRAKKRGRPKKNLQQYLFDLTITVDYYDPGLYKDIQIILAPDDPKPPYPISSMDDLYKKTLIEMSIRLVADLCYGSDSALIVELQEWLQECIMNYNNVCLLYTSDAADERSSVALGGRRII